MLKNGSMERRTKVLKIELMQKGWWCWQKFNLAIESWRGTFLKVYIIETQYKTCIFKVKRLLNIFQNMSVILLHKCVEPLQSSKRKPGVIHYKNVISKLRFVSTNPIWQKFHFNVNAM